MRRLYVFLFFSLLLSADLAAQVFGNEWIDYGKRYLKIKVTQDGIYRIDSLTLSNGLNAAGASLSSIDPRNFQLFHNGVEEYIWIEGENDSTFNSGDYLEFFGQRNDGTADAELYGGSSQQLDPYFSLYNDTAIYFLTWNNSITNRRLTNPNDTAFGNYGAPASFFTDKEVFYGNAIYMPGVMNSTGLTDPAFIPSEGYYDIPFDYGGTGAHTLSSANAYTSGPDNAHIRLRVGSHSDDWNNQLDNFIHISYLSNSFDTSYNGYAVATYSFTVPPSALNNSSTTISVSSQNNNGSASSGQTAIAWMSLDYPHNFDMEGRLRFYGWLPDNAFFSKSYLQLTNIGGSGPVRVYDFYNHQRIDAVQNGPNWQAIVANGNGSYKPFMVQSELGVQAITSLAPVNGNGLFTDFMQQAADSVFLIITHRSLMGVAADYKTYRMSAAGGFRNVVVADVNELYDQFCWGVGQSPLAIRHFADFLIHNYPTKPGQMLLLGKSIYGDYARLYGYYPQNLVPTYGYPPCDNSLTAGLNGTFWEPAIPTGRIAARDSVQARWYLDKVIDYENNTPEEWMKHVLHFGGGTDAGQQTQFANYLSNYADTIRDTLFGGIVETYLKTSSAPIQINQSDSLRQRIESGVSIMTFFGHASGTGFDQSIDDPTTYNNAGHYPLLIANSCYAGDIHSPGISSSEAFTLLDQKGTIGYIASVGLGFPSFLNLYSGRLYRAIGKTNYGQPIGNCIQWTVQQTQTSATQDLFLKTTCMEMTYEGDPAVVINSFPKPDYEITNNDVWFDQDSDPDSITVFAKVTNIGRAIDTAYVVRLQRTFPNGDTISFLQLLRAPKYQDTVVFTIPVDQQRGIGLNKIRIKVDYFSFVNEMNENNNSTQPDIDLLIHGSSIVPVYPYEFAVIPSDSITLRASTVNPLEPIRQYHFQIDTTDLFNSPFLQNFTIVAPGGVVSWHPNLLTADSTVYFWRVSPDSLTAADVFLWRESSFQYINGKTGWGQDHIFQYKNDGYQFVRLNRSLRDFEFVNDVKTISVKNGIYNAAVPWNEVWYKVNGATQHIFSCVFSCGCGSGVTVAVINPLTGIPWSYTSQNFGTEPGGYFNCVPGQPLYAFDFPDGDSLKQNMIANFIRDSIPHGYRVLIYSQYYHSAALYNSLLQNTLLDSLGSAMIGNGAITDTTAFILWGTKGGAPGSATEVIGTSQSSVLTLQDTLLTNWNSGYIASPVIGPAVQWGSFHWKQHPAETPDHDSVSVELIGITAGGTETLITTFPEDSTDILNLTSYVNASMYPYIRLVARMKDDTSRTPAQMDRWHVLYTPYPEAAVHPPLAYSFYNDTLQEGDTARLAVGIVNLTPWAFNDSLLFHYWIVDNNRMRHDLPDKLRRPPFSGYGSFIDTLKVSTTGYPGANELWLEVNPVGTPNSQLEPYHFNNVLMTPFNVSTDRTNPLLDVTFDGVHIMNNDIVSGKPNILITLKDENQFLALNDTADFNVFLKSPSQTVAQLMPWGPEMLFTPAVLPHNSCKILFTPVCSEDGTWELIVQAKDRSNNQSGLIDYRINFEVINKPSVTNVLNYPNPFSTSTQFVFTLTGNEVPQVFTIQIMTITGKVVREINRDELGDLHIGRNITSYAWDGRDMFGDQLANGVYLYRVITRLDGEAIDHRQSGADPYIIQGWGKMYLMR
jgi:hypothetical protein